MADLREQDAKTAARLDMIDEKRQSGVSLHINGLLGMGEALVLRGRGGGAALL
jgi:hypothetical protein